MRKKFLAIMLGTVIFIGAGCQQSNESDFSQVDASDFLSPNPVISAMPKADLNEDEISDLVYMREE